MRLISKLLSVIILLTPALALADPPVVASGECLYLYGAPPGEPAATTEVTGSATRIFDDCTQDLHVEVGRDTPHQIQAWLGSTSGGRGCQATAHADHEFVADLSAPAWVIVAASGDVSGLIETSFNPSFTAVIRFDLEIVKTAPEGEVVVGRTTVFSHEHIGNLNRLQLAQSWSGSVMALVGSTASLRARLAAYIQFIGTTDELDLGAPGSGYGAAYSTLSACVIPVHSAGGAAGPEASTVERDLHDKRCLPYLWLPEAQGGTLESTMSLVLERIDQAAASGDPHAQITIARDRMNRAAIEFSRGEFQRTCRSVSDALRALTTP